MIKLNKGLQDLIKKGRLYEHCVLFGDYGTFEEVPIVSRWSYINFLKQYDFEEKNRILLKVAFDVARKAINDANSIPNLDINEYFICVSITDWDDIEEFGCISPNIFISRRKSWILPLLSLRECESSEANILKTYLYDLNIHKKIVCVSKSYGGDNDRIYIVDDFFFKKNQEQG